MPNEFNVGKWIKLPFDDFLITPCHWWDSCEKSLNTLVFLHRPIDSWTAKKSNS